MLWLFVVLVSPLQLLEDYAAQDVLDPSAALHGLPVVVSDSYGLRYAVLIGSPGLSNEARDPGAVSKPGNKTSVAIPT